MAYPPRPQIADAVSHVFSRGTGACRIFLDGRDRERFLSILATVAERYGWRVHFFTLLGTHYHLVLTTTRPNIAAGMRDLLSTYCRSFNRKYERKGHLIEARYSSVLVEDEDHAVRLVPYLSLNAVRAGLVRRPEDWPWCSYGGLVGRGVRRAFLDEAWVLELFDADTERARALVRALVEEELERVLAEAREPELERDLGARLVPASRAR
jgi:putative transposase